MRKVSVIHCADIHYDSDIKFLGTKERRRCEERRVSFEKILKMCRTEKTEYLLIAGDLFDTPEPEEKYVSRLRNEFEKCSDTYIFIAPGNHDYVSISSPYRRDNFWPDNVYIFMDEWEEVNIEEDGVSVYGCGFREIYQRKSMMKACENDNYIHIGVMHGDIRGNSKYNPITQDEIADSGLDYFALGHIHKRTDILKSGNTYYSYSGCHDGRGFDETGVQGVYKGYVWKGGCDMKFHPVSSRILYRMTVNISGMSDEDIAEYLEDNIAGTYDDIYEITLTGNADEDYAPDIIGISEKLGLFYVRFLEEYSRNYDYDVLKSEKSVRGEFVKRMMSLIETEDDLVKIKALELGVTAFSKEVSYHED